MEDEAGVVSLVIVPALAPISEDAMESKDVEAEESMSSADH